MNTTENNKLIAEFLGYNKEEVNGEIYFTHDDMIEALSDEELFYHSDWNWLMEVVEKIEALKYEFIIETFEVRIEQHNKILSNQHTKVANQSKKEAVYNACIEFIKWYNKQNQ